MGQAKAVRHDAPKTPPPLAHVRPTAAAGFRLVTTGRTIEAEKVILATGGQSYPACGTTGDGYRWAAALGHRIVPPRPALVPVTSHAPWVLALQGVTLPDVVVRVSMQTWTLRTPRIVSAGQTVAADNVPAWPSSRGAMLFAHFGVTGPAVMDVSHAVSGSAEPSALVLRCDLLPDVPEERIGRPAGQAAAAAGKRRAASLLDPWLPHRVGETLLALIGTPPDRPLAELSKVERRRLAQTIKRLDIPVSGTMGFRKAEVTAGGVALEEVDSRTMQSRLVPDLYFAGEMLGPERPGGRLQLSSRLQHRLAGGRERVADVDAAILPRHVESSRRATASVRPGRCRPDIAHVMPSQIYRGQHQQKIGYGQHGHHPAVGPPQANHEKCGVGDMEAGKAAMPLKASIFAFWGSRQKATY